MKQYVFEVETEYLDGASRCRLTERRYVRAKNFEVIEHMITADAVPGTNPSINSIKKLGFLIEDTP